MTDEYFTPTIIKQLRNYAIVPGTKIPISVVMETLSNPDKSYDDLVKKYPALKKISQDEIFLNAFKLLKIIEEFLKREKEKYIEKEMKKAGLPVDEPAKYETKTKSQTEIKPAPPKYSFEIEGNIKDAKEIKIFIDGCSKGNPGPSSFGVIFTDLLGKKLFFQNKLIGDATNNTAEYSGLIFALEKALELGKKTAYVFSDSELVVKQMNGIYKIKNLDILELVKKASSLRRKFDKLQIVHISREENKETDKLANMAFKE